MTSLFYLLRAVVFQLNVPSSATHVTENLVTRDYIVSVSAVAIAVNGISAISKSIKRFAFYTDKRAYDVFSKFTLDLITQLTRENDSYRANLTVSEPLEEVPSEKLQDLTNSKKKMELNSKTLTNARLCYEKTKEYSKDKSKKREILPLLSFVFILISICVLVFSPQIESYHISNTYFLLLFLPQFLISIILLLTVISSFFPWTYLRLIWKVHTGFSNCLKACWDYEKRLLCYTFSHKTPMSETWDSLTIVATEGDNQIFVREKTSFRRVLLYAILLLVILAIIIIAIYVFF